MKTTKFGLNISVFAAILYLGAIQTPLIPLLMLGYAVLVERTREMNRLSCQAITVLGGLWLLNGVYTAVNQLVNLLNTFVGNGYLHMPYGLSSAVSLITDVVPLVFAVLAFLGNYAVLNPAAVDQAVKKVQAAAPAETTAQQTEEDAKQ